MSEGLSHFFGGAVCCGTCRFYAASDMECRRHPPSVMTQYDRVELDESHKYRGELYYGLATVFPAVEPDWWCGEYQPPAQETPK